jgi:hypothetical protein
VSRFKKVPVEDLIVDERYQRPLDEKRVEKMVENFSEDLFGVLEANQRNGKAAVFDGQHRLAVARARGMTHVPCLIHVDKTPAEEAALFVKLQAERKGISSVDRFRARVFQGEEAPVAINAILEAHGYAVGKKGRDQGRRRNVSAVAALERVYSMGVLSETIGLLEEVWGGDLNSTDLPIIEGLGRLVSAYGHRIGEDQKDKLREVPPGTIVRRVRGVTPNATGTSGRLAFAELRRIAGLRGAVKGAKRTKRQRAA